MEQSNHFYFKMEEQGHRKVGWNQSKNKSQEDKHIQQYTMSGSLGIQKWDISPLRLSRCSQYGIFCSSAHVLWFSSAIVWLPEVSYLFFLFCPQFPAWPSRRLPVGVFWLFGTLPIHQNLHLRCRWRPPWHIILYPVCLQNQYHLDDANVCCKFK